jgi:hypothetical protein
MFVAHQTGIQNHISFDTLEHNFFTHIPKFGDFIDRIYPIELGIKDTTDKPRSASYLDPYLEIDSEDRVRTKHYDTRDDFNFLFVNFPFIKERMWTKNVLFRHFLLKYMHQASRVRGHVYMC